MVDFIIANESNNRVLIQRRSMDRKLFPDKWEVTGGKLEAGETIVKCIVREMREKCQMELVAILALINEFVWIGGEFINLQFLVKASGEFVPEKDKISEYRWVGIDEIGVLLDDGYGDDIYKGVVRSLEYINP